ncbi:dynein regulatory complex subunit 4 [Phlebotomus argentipes]|uniref:dynein regulatory complex subunit 4 n=1 Tax=Phlebotomus argentipes TaxID=94469 RepID=UPI002892BA8A|nr:dynein regulatory complex subunit 4 [Phlebotomus argentipes]
MAPKRSKGKAKGTTVIDGVDTSSMTREQLEAFAHRLKNEMEREREERNFFQLERDKLRTFWEITRNQLEEARAIIRNKDREVEEAQEMAEVDIKHVTQQIKHLQYEHQTRLGEMKAEYMTQLKMAQEDHGKQEQELLKDKRELRRLLREKEESTELQIQQLKLSHSESLSEERSRYERELKELLVHQEAKMDRFIQENAVKNRMEVAEVEERKNTQIAKLIEAHDQAHQELKMYYNDITLNNLALISSLKEQMEELRQQSERNERTVSDVTAENRRLVEPLQEAKAELADLRKKLENYDRDRSALARSKTRCKTAEKKLNDHKWETEELKMRLEAVLEERDCLRGKFEEAVLELQQKAGLKNVLLERKISLMEQDCEKREAVLGEVLSVAGMEPQALSIRVEKLIQIKTDKIQDLQFEVIKITKKYNELLRYFHQKMDAIGIGLSGEELEFQQLKVPDYKLSTHSAMKYL